MIDYSVIKEVLRQGIWDSQMVFFVELENGDPRPDNQPGIDSFVSHKVTSPYIRGGNIERNEGNQMIQESSPTVAISMTCYSKDKTKALNLCHSLIKWFEFQGYQYLKDNDLIVSEITNITDRTTFLETGYDNRVGFDVIIRTSDTEVRTIETIEKVEINGVIKE